MMGILHSFLILASMSLSTGFQNVEIQHTGDGFKGSEDVIVAKDDTGKVLTTIIRYMDEGFQIEKPIPDPDSVCYLRKIEHKGIGRKTCFTRVPVPAAESDDAVLREKCEDRPIFFLKPIDCERTESDTEIRRRRDSRKGCILEPKESVKCVDEKKACCKWICLKKKCTKCLESETETIYVEKCGIPI